MADLRLLDRRPADAELLAERIDTLPGMSADAAAVRARARLALGDGDRARQTLEEAVAKHPQSLLLHELLANVLIAIGDRHAARTALCRLLSLNPANAWASQTLSRLTSEPPRGRRSGRNSASRREGARQ